jgi:deoxyribodipyrimidine photolyase-related protein
LVRNLVLVFGDQLNSRSAAFDGFDKTRDVIWMAEVSRENTHVWCHKLRIAYFLSAMRHFRDQLSTRSIEVAYHELTPDPACDRGRTFSEVLTLDVSKLVPEKLIIVEPGDWRVLAEIKSTAESLGIELEIRPDRHFYCSTEDFQSWASGKQNLVMEFFYRWMRKKHDVLMDSRGKPVGGTWNLDHDNRESFGKAGPSESPAPRTFKPDATTRDVMAMVEQRFADHPGSLEHFQLPVTRRQALAMLNHFIEHTLPNFGRYEDAMWTDEAFLYHSRLSAPLNLKLLNPRECVEAAVIAHLNGSAPLNSVEGFVRQVLGWREFIRGIYWREMPDYAELNSLEQDRDVPSFFWDGDTDMECARQSMQHVINHGYSHHIHRLMVLGNLSQLLGVHPLKFHEWHMAMYVDAVDWVSLPNTLGMSQFGDGGIVGTKPYCSTGNYINKMSPYCRNCRYDYRKRTGDDACPFTTLYWDFLDRNYDRLKDVHRMSFAIRNVEKRREDDSEMSAIRRQALEVKNTQCGR